MPALISLEGTESGFPLIDDLKRWEDFFGKDEELIAVNCRSCPNYLKHALKACRQEAHDQAQQDRIGAREANQHAAVAVCISETIEILHHSADSERLANARTKIIRLMRQMKNVELAEMMQSFVDKFCFSPSSTVSGTSRLTSRVPKSLYMSLAGAKEKLGIDLQTLTVTSIAIVVAEQDAPNPKHVRLARQDVRLFWKTVRDYASFIETFVASQESRRGHR